MNVRFMFGAFAALAFFWGTLSLNNVAVAKSERPLDSPSPVSTVSKEEIESIVDQRIQDIMRTLPQQQPQGPTDFSQPPAGTANVNIRGLGQTNQSQQRLQQGAG